MNMPQYADQAASQYKALLSAHNEVIFTHESIPYKLDDALKTLKFDDSGITAMVAIKQLYDLLCTNAHIKISAFNSKFEQVLDFKKDLFDLKNLIAESQIEDKMQDMAFSIKRYFDNSKQAISPELNKLLDNHSTVVDIYTKSLKSLKDFDVFVFNKGDNAVEGKALELFSPVYIWRDYNSLQAQYKRLDDGVYFCFIDCVFGFVIKNGSNFLVVSDAMEYTSIRRHVSKRYIPYSKNKVDAGYYLPYQLIQHKSGKLELQISNSETAEAFANQTRPEILCDVVDLPVNSLVYVVLMFELLVKTYGFDASTLNEHEIIHNGSSFILENAIEHKATQKLITVDELRHGVFHERFPESTYVGLNTRLEELFSSKVDQRLLNLIEHNGQQYIPDEFGRYTPLNEQITYKKGAYHLTENLRLFAFDMTMIGTPAQLEALRYNVARRNYAAMLKMNSEIYMSEQLPVIHKYLEKMFYANIENIEKLMGFPGIQTQIYKDHNKPWRFMTSEEYSAKDNNILGGNQWVKTIIATKTPGSSVYKCYETGSKRFQTIKFRVNTVEQLSFLLGVPVNKLPKPLNCYSWVSNNHHGLNDPVDGLWDIWEQRLIEFEVVLSKSHYKNILKKADAQQYQIAINL